MFFLWDLAFFVTAFQKAGWAQDPAGHRDSPGGCAASGSRRSQTPPEKLLC